MGILSTTKKVSGHFFNFKVDRWVDYEYLKNLTSFFVTQFHLLFRIKSSYKPETFAHAYQRLNMTPEELVFRSKQYLIVSYSFLGISLALISYAIYLLSIASMMGTIMTICIAFYSLTLVFRYHYLNYQLRRLTLGCSLRDWIRDLLSPSFNSQLKLERVYEQLPALLAPQAELPESTVNTLNDSPLLSNLEDNNPSLREEKAKEDPTA